MKRNSTLFEVPRRADGSVEFVVNEWMEALISLRDVEPQRFNKLSEATRRSVEFYSRAKEKASKQAA